MEEQYIRDLLPAYALGALDGEEAALVERSLVESEELQQELGALRAVVGDLPYAAPAQMPPEWVRTQLFARIEASQSALPRVDIGTAQRTHSPSPLWWNRITTVLGVALLACVLVLGGLTFALQRSVSDALAVSQELATRLNEAQQTLSNTRATQQQLEQQLDAGREQLVRNEQQLAESQRQLDLLANELQRQEQDFSFISAPGVATRDLRPVQGAPTSAAGRMYMRPGDDHAVIIFRGLGQLEPGKVYEFWLAQGSSQVPVGEVEVDAEGNARLTIEAPQEVNAFQEVMLTVESTPNSTTPSGTTVLEGNLAD